MGQDGLRIGLIGLGSMGRHHARVIRATPGMELVAVADPGGDRFGVAGPLPLLPDVEALIGVGLDAAVVAVPTIHHEEVALALARAGVHALVEQTPQAVTITLSTGALPGSGDCMAVALSTITTITLNEPLAGRQVIQGL